MPKNFLPTTKDLGNTLRGGQSAGKTVFKPGFRERKASKGCVLRNWLT